MPALDPIIILAVALIGLIGGTLGGMLGVGGSVVMIPGLVLLFGQAEHGGDPNLNQHVYQAAAMIANIAVSIPAALRHHKARATTLAAIRWMLPAAAVFVIVGVWISNQFVGRDGAIWLGAVLAAVLIYMTVVNLLRMTAGAQRREDAALPIITPPRCITVGAVMGTIAGVTGVGGGGVAVPLQQVTLRLPLKACIANSSTIICISAIIGSVAKNATLAGLGYDWRVSAVLALLLAPTCWLGGHMGAALTQRMPTRLVRVVFIVLMVSAIIRLLLPVVQRYA